MNIEITFFSAVLFLAINAGADLPPPPTSEELCEGKSVGERCNHFPFPEGWSTCQQKDGKLLCTQPSKQKEQNVADDKKNEVPAKDDDARGDGKAVEIPKEATIPLANGPKESASNVEGCSSLSALSSGSMSLLGIFFGLSLLLRNRKK